MKVFAAIVVVIVLLFAVGACRFEIYTTQVPSVNPSEPEPRNGAREVLQVSAGERAWRGAVNAACARRNERIAAVGRPREGLKDVARYAKQVRAIVRGHQRAVDAIAAPTGVEQEIAFVRDSTTAQERALDAVIAAARAGDASAAENAVTRYESVARMTGGALRSVDLDVCAQLG